jgi:hypothetical protein
MCAPDRIDSDRVMGIPQADTKDMQSDSDEPSSPPDEAERICRKRGRPVGARDKKKRVRKYYRKTNSPPTAFRLQRALGTQHLQGDRDFSESLAFWNTFTFESPSWQQYSSGQADGSRLEVFSYNQAQPLLLPAHTAHQELSQGCWELDAAHHTGLPDIPCLQGVSI